MVSCPAFFFHLALLYVCACQWRRRLAARWRHPKSRGGGGGAAGGHWPPSYLSATEFSNLGGIVSTEQPHTPYIQKATRQSQPGGMPARDRRFMAPEVLSSAVVPASDVWSAGVMAVQLLTGRFPFDDARNPANPSVAAIWRAILTENVDFSKPWWSDISPEARDFVAQLLNKVRAAGERFADGRRSCWCCFAALLCVGAASINTLVRAIAHSPESQDFACLSNLQDPAKRPTAKQALEHPWLAGGTSAERSSGAPLHASVVARIQRFGQNSVFKRTALQLVAEELLAMAAAEGGDASGHGHDQARDAAQRMRQEHDGSLPVAPMLHACFHVDISTLSHLGQCNPICASIVMIVVLRGMLLSVQPAC